MNNYQTLFGVTPEQVRAKQRAERQRMFSSAGSPQEASGLAIGSILARLLGGKSDELKDAEARQAFKSGVDWNDAESLRLLAPDAPNADIRLGMLNRAGEIDTQALAAAQAAEDRERTIKSQALTDLKKAEEIKQMRQPKETKRPFEQALKISEAYATTDPAKRLDSLQELTGKGWFKSEEELETLTPFLTTQAAVLMQADPTLSVDNAFAQATASYMELANRGTEEAVATDDFSDVKGGEEAKVEAKMTVEGQRYAVRPLSAITDKAELKVRQGQINDAESGLSKIAKRIEDLERFAARGRGLGAERATAKIAELRERQARLNKLLTIYNEGRLKTTEE